MCSSPCSGKPLTRHRYLPTFPLLCLAAQYSEQIYEKPAGEEKETLVGADWKTGTKAMVVKSAPMDDMNVIVFAIRGSQTFMDWVANFHSTPSSPEGFLVCISHNLRIMLLTSVRTTWIIIAIRASLPSHAKWLNRWQPGFAN